VVFDLDDTLYPERDYVASGFAAVGNRVEADRGIRGFSELAWRLFEDGRRGNIFDLAFEQLDIDVTEAVIRRAVDVYRRHTPTIALFPDAEECLARIDGHAALALISDGPAESQRRKVEALKLSRRIPDIILTEVLGPAYRKPSALAFEAIQVKHGASGHACVYIADNPRKDFIGPKSLGWNTIRVRRPIALYKDEHTGEEHAADHTIESLTEALSNGLI
jgi:putative hydrolase of the HAD superfamily